MILILFGVGVVAQVVTSEGTLGDHDSIAWAWGLGVTFGVYTAARISGAHLNPAVTLALAAFAGFSWRKVVPFALAQTAGAFVAALLVRWSTPMRSPPSTRSTPSPPRASSPRCPATGRWTSAPSTAFFDQIVGTAILLFLILAVTDTSNDAPVAWMAPFIVGLIVVAIGMAWGTNAGYAINPARDFGPRLASFLTGYGGAWRDQPGSLYFWVPIIGPLIGGLIGAGAYKLLIAPVHAGPRRSRVRSGEIPISEPAGPERRARRPTTNPNPDQPARRTAHG